MNVIILGCSRVGAMVAGWLSAKGEGVTVIDLDENSFSRLDKDFKGETITGNGVDPEVLLQAGIKKADAFIGVTDSDNTNIMAAQVVREKFKTKKILIRVYGPQRAKTFKEIGLNIICPTATIADQIKDYLLREGV
jgi:trk system potassium uptake protein TrkA